MQNLQVHHGHKEQLAVFAVLENDETWLTDHSFCGRSHSLRLLVSWVTGVLNDCEFVESHVEAQALTAGGGSWFTPQGCTGLALNAYHCQAEDLLSGVQYIFRVQSTCTDPLASSPYSVSSTPEFTLNTIQTWEESQRRVLSINIVSAVNYDEVITSQQLKDSLISRIVSHTADGLGVAASRVKVEIMPGAVPSGRRLSTTTAFAVTVEGAASEDSETSQHVVLGVSSALQAEAISAEVSLSSTSSLTPATAPGKILWNELETGRLRLNWIVRPLGDCSFLAWQVLAHLGSSSFPVAGCTKLLNLSQTECVAFGMDESQRHTFTVDVLCGNPATNSEVSQESDVWPASIEVIDGTLSALPSVARPCDQVVLSLFTSDQELTKQWMLSSPSSSSRLTALLGNATLASASALTLSSDILQELLAAHPGNASIVIGFTVQLNSLSGLSANVSSSVTIQRSSDELLPTISATGATEVNQKFEDELRLEVLTGLLSSCGETVSLGQVTLKTTWEYQASGAWQTLAAANLVDSSPLPNTLRLAAFALLPGSHQLRASVELEGTVTTQSASIIYTVLVTDSLPVLEILGARSVGVGCGIGLSCAVGSLHPEATLSYNWICLQPANCNSTVGSGQTGQQLAIDAAQAGLGSYTFRSWNCAWQFVHHICLLQLLWHLSFNWQTTFI